MTSPSLLDRIVQLTVPCTDDGRRFVQRDRLERIEAALRDARYRRLAEPPLARLYARHDAHPRAPLVLISCHIDSIYARMWAECADGLVRGTLDNSVCAAVVVEAMVRGQLPPQVLVSFTGNEERAMRGADHTVRVLQGMGLLDRVQWVAVLDVTESHFGRTSCTLENCFRGRRRPGVRRRFATDRKLGEYLRARLPGAELVTEAVPDEAWRYAAHHLDVFSFCLPCRVLGRDMHDVEGVAVQMAACVSYYEALIALMHAIAGSGTAAPPGDSLSTTADGGADTARAS